MRKTKHIDPIPDEFPSYEEAGEFWDIHAITDYPEMFRAVEPDPGLRQRRTTARKHATSAVARQLWHCVDRLDYLDYFKQAAPLPREPLAYQP